MNKEQLFEQIDNNEIQAVFETLGKNKAVFSGFAPPGVPLRRSSIFLPETNNARVPDQNKNTIPLIFQTINLFCR